MTKKTKNIIIFSSIGVIVTGVILYFILRKKPVEGSDLTEAQIKANLLIASRANYDVYMDYVNHADNFEEFQQTAPQWLVTWMDSQFTKNKKGRVVDWNEYKRVAMQDIIDFSRANLTWNQYVESAKKYPYAYKKKIFEMSGVTSPELVLNYFHLKYGLPK